MKALKNLLLSLGATLAVMLAVEGVCAVFGVTFHATPFYPGDVTETVDANSDPWTGWKLPPSQDIPESTADYSVTYRSNAQGFRSRHDFASEPPGRGIVFLGDSYTFGSGAKDGETFVDLLEHDLGAPCYDLGIGAWGVDQMGQALVHYGLPLRPRLVALSFIDNDLGRSLSAYRKNHAWRAKPVWRLEDGALVPMTAANRPSAAWRFFERHSRFWGLWLRVEDSLAHTRPIGYRWKLNRALFARIRDDCREAGVPLVVFRIPVNNRTPAPMYAGEFAALGIDFLDLTDRLPADADALYYPSDHHFNAAGHRFAAGAMRDFLAPRLPPVLPPALTGPSRSTPP